MSADWTGCTMLLLPIPWSSCQDWTVGLLPSTKLPDLALPAQGQPGFPPKTPSPVPETSPLGMNMSSASHPSSPLLLYQRRPHSLVDLGLPVWNF